MMRDEVVAIDDPSGQKSNKRQDGARKTQTQKRKRASLEAESKDVQIESLGKELDALFGFYKQVMGQRVPLDLQQCGNNLNSVIGALIEESGLPLSKLVQEVFDKVKDRNEVFGNATLAYVKSIVLFVGQRVMYGVPNVDADVLEDESQSCLWCWETRDVKLMPASVRGELNIRRTCRRKIHERITAVSAMTTALQKMDSDQNYKNDLLKASEQLQKALCEAKIRSLMSRLSLKNGSDMAKKDAKREDKLLIKQMEREKREAEKEKKRLERERQKDEWQSEKELKRLQGVSEKDEKRREKEESEMWKLQRKQQEDAEREQRRREKEEAELKKQLSIKKQASIMERFIKRSKTSAACQDKEFSTKVTLSDVLHKDSDNMPEVVTQSMDQALLSTEESTAEDIRRSHLSSWRHLGNSIRSNRNQHWGRRQLPKTEIFKELKLTTSKGLVRGDDLTTEKLVDRWGEHVLDDRLCQINTDDFLPGVKKCKWGKQLLQFDKSCRPAFYGKWPKKSHVVRPCHPFRKDPDLDYDAESDEEWEEEDPGESLSDCDKDDEEEIAEEGCSKADEDESEDGFFVPDGYLSENEGVQVDRMETDITCVESRRPPSVKQGSGSEKFSILLRQQKYVGNLTERALQKNQPLIISNLMHEKDSLLTAEDLTGTPKLEQMCLQALSMQAFPGGSPAEISVEGTQEDDQEVCLLSGKCCVKPISALTLIPDSDLPTIVSVIQSCSQGINKVLQNLQQKFPAVSKSQLRNKVREISDFVDNRWQVKKEVLDKVGLSKSPEKSAGRTKSIAAFFSKRCLPPTGKIFNPDENSSQPAVKPGCAGKGQRSCTYEHP